MPSEQPPAPSEPPASLPAQLQQQLSTQPPPKYYGTPTWLHFSATAIAIIAPVALLLPPRRLSVQNAVLAGCSAWAGNLLIHDHTGKSVMARLRRDAGTSSASKDAGNSVGFGSLLPGDRAARNRDLLAAERARREAAMPEEERRARVAERERRRQPGLLGRLWMGGEKEGWREERLAREREALQSGKGYSGLIADHLSEVWSQEGKKKGGEQEKSEGGSVKADEGDGAGKSAQTKTR